MKQDNATNMPAAKAQAKPGKLKPSDLYCARPYMLTYSARVKPATDAEVLLDYINNYRATCQALYKLVRDFFVDPANHLALYAVFLPAKVPEAIAQTRFWQENMVGSPTTGPQPLRKPVRQLRDTKKIEAGPPCPSQPFPLPLPHGKSTDQITNRRVHSGNCWPHEKAGR